MKGDSSSPEETVASSSYFENIGLSYAHIHLSKQGKKIFGRAAEQDKCIRHNKHIVNVFLYTWFIVFFIYLSHCFIYTLVVFFIYLSRCSYMPELLFFIYLSRCLYMPELLLFFIYLSRWFYCSYTWVVDFIVYLPELLLQLDLTKLLTPAIVSASKKEICIFIYIYITPGKKSASWQLVADVRAKQKRRKTAKMTQKIPKRCLNLLRNSGCRRF